MKKTKVLLAITKGNWGGAQKYVFDLATRLPAEQFDVTVLCGTDGNQLATKLAAEKIRTIQLKALRRDVGLFADIASFFSLLRMLERDRPDVLHLNSSKMGAMGAVAGRLADVPRVIFTGHGWAWNEDRSFLSKAAITFFHWITVLCAHKTIAVSEEIRRQILRLPFISKNRVEVIHNGIVDTEYLERFAARGTFNNRISEKFWIGTIAELHKNKGLDFLIRAFAKISPSHPDTALLVIGEGEERARLTALAAELGIDKKVHLVGFVENARAFLKAFDVFVLPSRTEAFPYVILEAGLAQLPVVATRVGGIPEVILPGNGMLVEKENVDALAQAMTELLEDSAKAVMYGHNLRKTVEKSFAVDTMVQKTKALYNE